ncbi:hypothetical protein KY285_019705 [Solanum tuberosum]|nr:hypothetical protein KY285_019705 [Solanum tuberosum]
MYEALEEGGEKEIGEASRGNKNGEQTASEKEEPSKSTNEKGLFGEEADRIKEIADMEGIKRLNSTQKEGQIEASSGESKTFQSINLNQSVEGLREDDQRDSNKDIGSSHSTKSSPMQHYNHNKENVMELREGEKSNEEQTNINSPTQQEKQQQQDNEEDECIEANIESIGRSGDLSPTQIERLKVNNKRGIKINQPSQIHTRSRKGSVRSQNAFERVIDLNRRHHYSYIALLEPFQSPSELEYYRRKLGLPNAKVSSSAKIWIFWEENWEEEGSTDTTQQLTMNFKLKGSQFRFSITAVYARCSAIERLELWEDLEFIASQTAPWLVGGDFNTIVNESEKLGGLPVTQVETQDFTQCINACALNELKFRGSVFTWWNGRIEESCIFKRLDRVFGNNSFMTLLPESEVHHLIRHGSDHAPLHVLCNSNQDLIVKPFKFLNFWIKHSSFKKIVEDSWTTQATGSPFSILHMKMKRLKVVLTQWSKATFGNIFQKIDTLEDVIKEKEIQLEMAPTEANRAEMSKANAELKRYRKIEEDFWKQKAGMRWFKEGDSNTKFFHAYVKGRRRKLNIKEIKTGQGDIINSAQNIGEEAVNVFREQFKETHEATDYTMIQCIPRIITEEQNQEMERVPTKEEVKHVVFELNGDSASGQDGYSGQFFQSCWEIIGEDVWNMVRAFFSGYELPRYITHTNLVLIPKKDVIDNFGDLRPISLSTFANKIISRLIHERLSTVLPRIISVNQTGFVKGRSITENVLLAQEIIKATPSVPFYVMYFDLAQTLRKMKRLLKLVVQNE